MGWVCWIAPALVALLAQGPARATEPLLWFEDGRPSAQAAQAVAMLTDAGSHGLDPAEYDAEALDREIVRARSGGLEGTARAMLDRRLTAAIERYFL